MKIHIGYRLLSHRGLVIVTAITCSIANVGRGQSALPSPGAENNRDRFPRNYDESRVPAYQLPDPLVSNDGTVIDTPELWESKRRPEIIEILESNLFGRPPGEIDGFEAKVVKSEKDGDTLIQQVVLTLIKAKRSVDIDLLIFLPAEIKSPVPMILSMNFKGNHTVTTHPAVRIENPRQELLGRRSDEKKIMARGSMSYRFPIDQIISRGWGLITYAREDIIVDAKEPDFKHGVFSLFTRERKPDHWGGMAAWAWSMSRVIDYMETNPSFDMSRIAVKGSSRLGIATTWAGARDERIKVTIPNVAGKAGTSLLKRHFGINSRETMTVKTQRFCDNFRTWADRIDEMPFDVHFTLSLVAPRALYISHAEDDIKVDHRGVFLAIKAMEPVYELYGREGLSSDELPEVDGPVFSRVGMHIRSGKHECLPYDWEHSIRIAPVRVSSTGHS